MSKSSKRRDNDLVQTPPVRSAALAVRDNTSRNTFRAAQARRVLASDLPDIIYQGRPKMARLEAKAKTKVLTPTPAPPSRPERAPVRSEPKPLDARKEDDRLNRCKSRPRNSKGNGGSRPFVPWCR